MSRGKRLGIGLLVLLLPAAIWLGARVETPGDRAAPPPEKRSVHPEEESPEDPPSAPEPAAEETPDEIPGEDGPTAVEVRVSEFLPGLEFRRIPGAEVTLRDPRGETHRTRTGAEGTAVFPGIPPGESAVRAAAPGYVPSEWRTGAASGYVPSEWRTGAGTNRSVILERGISLDGEVLHERGMGPVEGAEVRVVGGRRIRAGRRLVYIWPPPNPNDPGQTVTITTVRTGPDGRFHVDAVTPERPLYVIARAPGLGPAREVLETPALDEKPPYVVLVLGPRGTLSGVVRDGDGRPIPGADVFVAPAERADLVDLLSDGSLPPRHYGIPDLLAGRADGQGRYRVEGLLLGVGYTAAAAREDRTASAPRSGIVATAGAREPRADFVLGAKGSLVVRILTPDGKPAQGTTASVSVTNWGGSSVPGSGVHEFWNLRVSAVTLFVRAPGYPPEKRRVKIPPGGKAEVTVRLVPGLTMTGTVTDRQGRPVAGAEILATARDEEGWCSSGGWPRVKTDAHGKVRIEGLRPLVHRVEARAEGFAAGFTDHEPRGGPFTIALGRGGILRGTVRDRQGNVPEHGVVWASGPDRTHVMIGKDGAYELRLPPGLYRLRATPIDWGSWSHPVEVTEGGVTELDLTMD